uniref:DNA helicase Pif1-like 2B domain-containing protein n=1 Tax=Octopus bimaculoides TaxID=37653 RepID=A0A0L8HDT6_OCTBM
MRARIHEDPLSEDFARDIFLLGNGEVPEDGNEDVDIISAINNSLLLRLPSDVTVYKSVYTIPNQDEVVDYPTEFLNSLEPSGVPPHILTLKVDRPVMLITNLNPPTLCNGTHLVITKLLPSVIEATIMTVCGKGQDISILRIPLVPLAADLTFTFHRVQFAIRLSYAMSINKSQEQSPSVVGLYLAEPCFSRGQLYVCCSRVVCRNSLHAFIPQWKTKNVVYKEDL